MQAAILFTFGAIQLEVYVVCQIKSIAQKRVIIRQRDHLHIKYTLTYVFECIVTISTLQADDVLYSCKYI